MNTAAFNQPNPNTRQTQNPAPTFQPLPTTSTLNKGSFPNQNQNMIGNHNMIGTPNVMGTIANLQLQNPIQPIKNQDNNQKMELVEQLNNVVREAKERRAKIIDFYEKYKY
ncbi:unnamed protein product [Paramecium pentaurelia]|uniref:Uncharacterized protein n=1 Tax=Paramecium pentaurelia TaxID=43138 RepID=A0A8S1TXN1_9CILI|nr:unnamed protein product [Paramecium pentaurelia]